MGSESKSVLKISRFGKMYLKQNRKVHWVQVFTSWSTIDTRDGIEMSLYYRWFVVLKM